jgi:hypothetical protein
VVESSLQELATVDGTSILAGTVTSNLAARRLTMEVEKGSGAD